MTYENSQAMSLMSNSQTLRQQTKHQHQELDAHHLIRVLQSKDASKLDYLNALVCFRQAYSCLEPILLSAETTLAIPAANQFAPRLPALDAELDSITTSPVGLVKNSRFHDSSKNGHSLKQSQESEFDNNRFATLLGNSGAASYWGMRYVLDGSCHGAKILLPRFEKQFRTEFTINFAYWKLLAGLQSAWVTTTTELDTLSSQDLYIALDAAKHTFNCFTETLNNHEARP